MAYGIGESCLLTVKNIMGKIIALKCVSKQILALSILVELLLGIN